MQHENILIIDSNSSSRDEHRQALNAAHFRSQEVKHERTLDELLASHPVPELVVISMPITKQQRSLIDNMMQLERRPLFLFLLSDQSHQQASEALKIGADEILRAPFTSHDLVTRVQLLAERRRREHIGRPEEASSGELEDISVRELIELFALGGGTATIVIQSASRRGKLFFRNGRLFGTTLNQHEGFEALIRLLQTSQGNYNITPGEPQHESNLGELSEDDPLPIALKSLARWEEFMQQLPSRSQQLHVDFQKVQDHFEGLNDLSHQLLWQLASHRSLESLLNDLEGDSIQSLEELTRLYQKNYFSILPPNAPHPIEEHHTEATPTNSSSQFNAPNPAGYSEFDSLLAAAAQEAALHLVAAAQPIDSAQGHNPENSPSFFDLPSFGLTPPPQQQYNPPTHYDSTPQKAPFSSISAESIPALMEQLRTGTSRQSPFSPNQPPPQHNKTNSGNTDRSTRPELKPIDPSSQHSGLAYKDLKTVTPIDSFLPPEDDDDDDELHFDAPVISQTNQELPAHNAEAHELIVEITPSTPPPFANLVVGNDPVLSAEGAPATIPDVVAATEADLANLANWDLSTSVKPISALQEEEVVLLLPAEDPRFADDDEDHENDEPIEEPPSISLDTTGQDLMAHILKTESSQVLNKLLQSEFDLPTQPPKHDPVLILSNQQPHTDNGAQQTLTLQNLDSHSPSETIPFGTKIEPLQRPHTQSSASFSLDSNDPELTPDDDNNLADLNLNIDLDLDPIQMESISLHVEDPIPTQSPFTAPTQPRPAADSSSLGLSDEFFIEDLTPRQRNDRWIWLLAIVVLVGAGLAGWYRRKWNNPQPNVVRRTLPAKPIQPGTPPNKRVLAKTPTNTIDAGTNTPDTPTNTPDAPTNTPDASTITPPDRAIRRAPTPIPIRPNPVRKKRIVRKVKIRKKSRVARAPRNRGSDLGRVRRLLKTAERLKKRERFKEAERILRRALGIRPRLVPLLVTLGNVLYEQNKGAKALRYLETAYRLSPRKTANGLVTLGSIYYEKNKLDQARRVYRQYLKFYPRGKHVRDVRSMLKNITLNN